MKSNQKLAVGLNLSTLSQIWSLSCKAPSGRMEGAGIVLEVGSQLKILAKVIILLTLLCSFLF